MSITKASKSNVQRAKRCLALIRDIAARGASSQDAEHVGYCLQELSQVLFERTSRQERQFEPVSAVTLSGLEGLEQELDFIDGCSQDFAMQESSGPWHRTAFESLN